MVKGSQPLANEVWERFCTYHAAGYKKHRAYQMAKVAEDEEEAKRLPSKPVAATHAWRLLKNAEITDRIQYLTRQRLKRFTNPLKGLDRKYKEVISDESCSHGNLIRAMGDYAKFIGAVSDGVNLNTDTVHINVEFEKPDENQEENQDS